MRAVIFDLDGTLIDSAPALRDIAGRYLAELGAAPLTLEEVRRFVGDGVRTFLGRAHAARGLALEGQALEAAHDRYRAIYAAADGAANPPFPGVVAALDALAARGLALGLCTNKPMAPTEAVLAALGWKGRFGAVVAGDSLPVLKPDPAPLLETAARLGVAGADALYVGDSETDAATAAAAGIRFGLYLHGYRKGPAESIRADLRFDDWARLPDLLAAAVG